jgi:KaiC/GvpD/RAD55 family RecA-like ATPase
MTTAIPWDLRRKKVFVTSRPFAHPPVRDAEARLLKRALSLEKRVTVVNSQSRKIIRTLDKSVASLEGVRRGLEYMGHPSPTAAVSHRNRPLCIRQAGYSWRPWSQGISYPPSLGLTPLPQVGLKGTRGKQGVPGRPGSFGRNGAPGRDGRPSMSNTGWGWGVLCDVARVRRRARQRQVERPLRRLQRRRLVLRVLRRHRRVHHRRVGRQVRGCGCGIDFGRTFAGLKYTVKTAGDYIFNQMKFGGGVELQVRLGACGQGSVCPVAVRGLQRFEIFNSTTHSRLTPPPPGRCARRGQLRWSSSRCDDQPFYQRQAR